jgi:Tol biopolymer transport system component
MREPSGDPAGWVSSAASFVSWMSSWSRDGQWIYFASDHSGSWEIWKIPSEGGAPIQVTTAGGLVAYESPDGAHLYYTKPEQDGIWRRPVSDGAEECFLKAHKRWAWGNWAVTDGGIYYVDRASGQLAYYAFDSGATRLIAEIPELYNPSLSVSPDGTSMLYAQVVSRGSDVMVVE